MSTPIDSPWCRRCRSSSGSDGSARTGPGMFRPWREATAPPTSISHATSQASTSTSVTRRRTEPSAR